jgi:hypothetical protein
MTGRKKLKILGKANMLVGALSIPLFAILLVLARNFELIYNIRESLARGFGIMFCIFFVIAESVASVYIVISGVVMLRAVLCDKSLKAFMIIDAVAKMLFAFTCGTLAVIMLMLYFYSAGILGLMYSLFLIAVAIVGLKYNRS